MGGTALALVLAAQPALAQDGDVYCDLADAMGTEEVFERFDRLDTDGDDRITLREYEACLDEAGIEGDERERLVSDFRSIDREDDDAVAREEIEMAAGGMTRDRTMAGADGELLGADVVSLAEWRYDDVYGSGISAEEFIDEMEVRDQLGEEIGDVEDLIVGQDGSILAVIAEVGGFWDMGDTHVSVPWEDVEVSGGAVTLPVTEETVEDYDIFDREYLSADGVANRMIGGVDAADLGGRAYRLSELIGDYARFRGDDGRMMNYGYVSDVILRDDGVSAVVVNPGVGMGAPGYRAYPYYGRGYMPGSRYYDMPYREGEMAELEEFDYDRL
jgi:sporulation protein YlmC with PRC-barrel domain